MKLKDFLMQFEGLDLELDVGIFEGGDLFKSNLDVKISKVTLVRPDVYVKAFTTTGYSKEVIIIAE